ncbi:MAG: hypothetical protein U0263_20390 [Polyangiaceae bacterium]
MLMVTNLLRQIVAFYPPQVRQQIEAELPAISIEAMQLGMQVLAAEHHGVRYANAVTRPEYLKLGRLYFGAKNMLQWRLPPPVREALQVMLEAAARGAFDPTGKIIFAIATRKHDPEAAVCRFLLWVAVQINLLALTWDSPEVELIGTLADMEAEAERVLRELLDVEDMSDSDTRPLHVLVAEMTVHMSLNAKQRFADAMRDFGDELKELVTNAEALEAVRKLDDHDAAMFWPGRFDGQAGSQQIVDRYPQHFTKANTMEQQRRRLFLNGKMPDTPTDRFIDLIRAAEGGTR